MEYLINNAAAKWENHQTEMLVEFPDAQFSSTSPYAMTVTMQMTEAQIFSAGTIVENSSSGTQLRITDSDEEGTFVQLFTKQ